MDIIALGLWLHGGKSQTDTILVSLAGEPKVILGDVPLDLKFPHGFHRYQIMDFFCCWMSVPDVRHVDPFVFLVYLHLYYIMLVSIH